MVSSLWFQFAVPQTTLAPLGNQHIRKDYNQNAANETAARARRAGLSGKEETDGNARRHGGLGLLPLQLRFTFL
jgi:hypothetical protein